MIDSAAAVAVATVPLVTDDELAAIERDAGAGLPIDAELARRMVAEIRRGRHDLFTLAIVGTQALLLLDQMTAAYADAWPPGCPPPADRH